MATIGTANASYYASTSIARVDRLNSTSVEKIAKAHQSIADGDRAAFASMNNTFMLDVAATNGALKSMAVTQAYLSTALTAIDNASGILSQMQQLAVLGANGTNNSADAAAIDAEAEALADAFYLSLTEAEYKGKRIFAETETGSKLSFGGRGAQGTFGIDVFDYDNFYDYKNPNTESLLDGVEYQVTRELTNIEKEAILARSSGSAEEDIEVGYVFKTNPSESVNVGAGSIAMLDDTTRTNASDGNLLTYTKGDGAKRIDIGADVQATGEFNGGSIEFAISDNWETSDILSLASTDKIFFRDDGEVVYNTTIDGVAYAVEIGKIDSEETGLDGLNGKPLKINLYSDATIPAQSPLENGNFEKPVRIQGDVPYKTFTIGEHRDGIVASYTVASGAGYAAANDTVSTGLERGSDTYSVTFEGGNGTGFRANLEVDNGAISIVNILDKGKDYKIGDVLTLSPGSLGAGTGFSVTIDGIVNSAAPGEGAINIEDVTSRVFETVEVYEEQTGSGVYDWGENYSDNQLRKVEATAGEAGATTDYYRSAGATELNLGNLGNTNIASVFNGNNEYTTLIDNDGNTKLSYLDQAIILERVDVANARPQADMLADPSIFAIYETDASSEIVKEIFDQPVSGSQAVTVTSQINPPFDDIRGSDVAIYARQEPTLNDTPIEPGDRFTPIYGNEQIVDSAQPGATPNYETRRYGTDEYQAGDTPVIDGTERIEVGLQNGTDTPIYQRQTGPGNYSWGESYQSGDVVKEFGSYAANGNGDSNYYHTSAGTYSWASIGQFEYESGAAFSASFNTGDVVLEKSDTGGAGWAAVLRLSEVPEVAFYVRNKTLNTNNVIDAYERAKVIGYDREEIKNYTVRNIVEYDRESITHYERTETTGYSRDKVAFYLEQKTLLTKNVLQGTVEKYIGEQIDTTKRAHTGWDRTEQSLIPNWTEYNDQVIMGEGPGNNFFEITETENGTLIQSFLDPGSDLGTGEYIDNSRTVQIPVPGMADMLKDPAYEVPPYEYETKLANPAVKGRDDFTPATVLSDGSVELIDRSTDGIPGSGLKLSTGNFNFAPGDNFGVYHGPAIVSDVFTASKDQFLKLDYAAAGLGDDYHVTGYIYNVDENNPELHLAIGDTGTEANSRKSVQVPEDGDYRFVFIVGTYDKTGGRLAGADMTIDNIVVENPYSIQQDALTALAQALQYSKSSGTDDSNPLKIMTTKISNGLEGDDEVTLFDETNINLVGYGAVDETNGPYAIVPTYDLVAKPSSAQSLGGGALTSKIEAVHEQLRTARIEAATSYSAIAAAIENVTDLRSQYAMGSNTISNLNFTQETAYLSKIQIQQDVAAAMLAQANKAQEGLMLLI